MKPFWTDPNSDTAWYRMHILERNYSVKVTEDPFGEIQILEIKSEWSGGRSVPRLLRPGEEYEAVSAAFLDAKNQPQD